MKKFMTAASALLSTTVLVGAGNVAAQEPAEATAESENTEQVIVRGQRIPDAKRVTSEITSLLDAESFERTGDSDIGQALQRVTGLSLSQGRFVVVRGLNERYSSVTINGSPLPSPEPLRRVVPLDIVPTSILESAVVSKTFAPELSGDFGGGAVDIRTKAVPDEGFFDISVSGAANTETTLKGGLGYEGGDQDWTGFDDGTRNTPDALAALFADPGFATANQDDIDRSLNVAPTTVVVEENAPADFGLGVSLGKRYDLSPNMTLGIVAVANYDNSWETRNGRRDRFSNLTPVLGDSEDNTISEFTRTTNDIETNAFATFGLDLYEDHTLTLTNFLLRSTQKQALTSLGFTGRSPDTRILSTTTDWLERQVWQSQLRGEHTFGIVDLDWRFAYGEAFRDAPYQWGFNFSETPGGEFIYDSAEIAGSNPATLRFSKLEDTNADGGFDIRVPFDFGVNGELKLGYAYTDKDRDVAVRFLRIQDDFGGLTQAQIDELVRTRVDRLLAPDVLGSELFDLEYQVAGVNLDNASSALEVNAFYGGFDIDVGPYIRAAIGARYEDGEQTTEAFSTLNPNEAISTAINETYLLPAATVTWNPIGQLQVRVGASQTITRPQFRELTPAFFRDDETDLLLLGNPFLQDTETTNYDARLEYYFSRGQFFTFGLFYKDIEKPIEDVLVRDLGGLQTVSYINSPKAELYGFEAEFEKNFVMADMFEGEFFGSKDLIVKANYTYSTSEVDMQGDVTLLEVDPITRTPLQNIVSGLGVAQDSHPLIGQSDHLINVQVGYEDAAARSRATLLVNFASERLRSLGQSLGGGDFVPNVVEQPPTTLDFVYSRTFEASRGEWEMGFSVRNILGDEYEATQQFADGSETDFDTYEVGTTVSASLKRSF